MSDEPPTSHSGLRVRRSTIVNGVLLLLAVIAFVMIAVRSGDERGIEVERREAPSGIDEMRVEVRGAVVRPGVVGAAPGDRVADVVERAGGFLPDADLDGVNLAMRVRDEDVIDVPFAGEPSVALVDLNTAPRADLEALPGIGPARAEAIIEARPLAEVEELLGRDLVPSSVFEDVRWLVVVR